MNKKMEMDFKILYNPKEQWLFITTNFAERQKRMDLGTHPKIEYKEISISDFEKFAITGISFEKVDDSCFQFVKKIFSNYEFEAIAFHNSVAELSNVVLNVKHLLVGDNSKINLSNKSFKNLKEITFLSVKTFKGKILDKIESVVKLTLWYENKKANSILPVFPNLKELIINNGTMEELDLTENPQLEKLRLHYCTKLEKVVLKSGYYLEDVFIERCKKLDIGNLGNVKKVG